MRAMVYHGNKDLRLERVPEPVPDFGEVKMQVDLCGICATDIEEYQYGPVFISHSAPHPLTGKMLPIITGHELTATVVEIGQGVEDVELGTRVAVHGILTCGTCSWCRKGYTSQCPFIAPIGFARDGGLAEFLCWPASHVIPLPNHVSSEEAALVEPTSVAYHAFYKSCPQAEDTVAILGVGTIGMLAVQIAKAAGTKVFAIDLSQRKLDMAERLGADATINSSISDIPKTLMELTEGIGPDIVIDCAGGSNTTKLAVESVRKGGRVVLVAIYTSTPKFDFNSIVGTEISITGSIANNITDAQNAVKMIGSGQIQTKPLVSDIIGLESVIDSGFERMLTPTKDVFRILVSPSKTEYFTHDPQVTI